MSELYNDYIKEHKENVKKAFEWMKENIPEIFDPETLNKCEYQCVYEHDNSKYNPNEYYAYDAYFYSGNRSYAVVREFKEAWLIHIHNNPHHWQHWVLINDEPGEGIEVLDMPYNYIIEMICDWWSFSWKIGNLNEIFDWYNEHKTNMRLSNSTDITVINILDKIKSKLNQEERK